MISLWTWICSILPKKALGVLTKIIFQAVGSVFVGAILNKSMQEAAYKFVKELNDRKDLTTLQKAEKFNHKFMMWCLERGKEVKESVINCLREWAVIAVKSEMEKLELKKKKS